MQVWAVGGADAQDPQAGPLGPGGCRGWGLGSRNRRCPGVPPTPSLRGQGTSPGSPGGFLGLSEQSKCLPLLSSPALLVWEGHSCLPLLISPASLLCPQDPRSLEGTLECRGPAWELSRLPEWVTQSPSTPLLLLPESSSRLPLLISLASGAPILSSLHFSSSLTPPCPTGSLWGSPHLLGHQSFPPAGGRCPSCGGTNSVSSYTTILTLPRA